MDVTLADADALLAAAREAAAVLMEGYRRPVEVEHKGPIDLVTRWDRASEDRLRAALARAFPGVTLVAEESSTGAAPDGLALWADPLDGTTNFVHGLPLFAVSIGLAAGPTLLAGAVVAPALGLAWHGARGHGAYRNGIPCQVSATASLDRALLATGFPYDNATNPLDNFAEFAALTRRSRGVRRCGAASLDLCFTADGTFDGYWERSSSPGTRRRRPAGDRSGRLGHGPRRRGDGLPRGMARGEQRAVHDELVAALAAVPRRRVSGGGRRLAGRD
ncbi:MAG: inositol monophosphatase [Deltaproteobacteria bacterium]|nr:inositol monophosphatase [Deltaproteobacteria bacterium]